MLVLPRELADHHHLRRVIHELNAGDLTDLEQRFYVDRTRSHRVIATARSPDKKKGVSRSSHPLEADFLRE